MTIGRLEELCLEHGLRISERRRTILRVLDEAEDHPSIEDIYQRAILYDRHLAITTVYRTVRALVERGLLSRIEFGDGKARYEDARGVQHEHLVDVDTGKIVELSDPAIQDLLHRIAKRSGYRLLNYRLELFGEASSKPALRKSRRLVRSLHHR